MVQEKRVAALQKNNQQKPKTISMVGGIDVSPLKINEDDSLGDSSQDQSYNERD